MLPSVLIGKPIPEFALAAIEDSNIPGFTSADLKAGGVSVVNIWASWCGPCRLEHPLLMELSKRTDIRLYGINNTDKAENARRFFGTLGQPYAADWCRQRRPHDNRLGRLRCAGNLHRRWQGHHPLQMDWPAFSGNYERVFTNEIEKAKLPAL